jgi:hypothetical protein
MKMAAYDSFVQAYQWTSIEQTVRQAYDVVVLFEMHRYEIKNLAESESITRASWYKAVDLFIDTQNKQLSLYERCQAEDVMRQAWRQFQYTFVYEAKKTPSVPSLPED